MFSPSLGSLLLYTFSIRQKGDRDGGFDWRTREQEEGFYTSDPQTVSVLMRDLKRGRDGATEGWRQGRHLNTCRGGEPDKHVFQCVNVCT